MPFGLTNLPGPSADEGDEGPPPPSQSHFAKFEHFTPNDAASFDDEFARLASSQQWVPGSQEYTRQRTIAMREELQLHYFSQPQQLDDSGGVPQSTSRPCSRSTPMRVVLVDWGLAAGDGLLVGLRCLDVFIPR